MTKPKEMNMQSGQGRFLYSGMQSPFTWSTGPVVGAFLTHLRDQEFLGRRCLKCGTVSSPPFDHCERCGATEAEWMEVGPGGTLRALTLVHHAFSGQPAEPPYALALIQLDGSDTSLCHLLKDTDLSQLRIGDRVEPVFRPERTGSLRDISHFRPAPRRVIRKGHVRASVRQEIQEVVGRQRVPFEYSYGRLYPIFYGTMRDQKKLVTVKCSKCGKAILPPRPYCGACFADAKQWVELPDTGTIKTFTVVFQEFLGQPKKPPYCYVVVVPDGHVSEIHHLLEGVDFNQVRVGMRVKAVWEEDRRGTIWDIKHFKPLAT
jgi:hypothetical protein